MRRHLLCALALMAILVTTGCGPKDDDGDTPAPDTLTEDTQDTAPSTDASEEPADTTTAADGAEPQGDGTPPSPEDTAGPDEEDVSVPEPEPEPEPVQCPPEGSEVVANPPPTDIPEGTCEDQLTAVNVTLEEGVTEGTQIPSAFVYMAPPDAKGLLLSFHGGGGSKEDTFGRVEGNLIFTAAVQAGYIVVALDSIAHIVPRDDGKTKWNEDATPCNPDTENVNALIRHFKSPDAMGLLDADAPVFAFGVSNGGSMTSRAAQHLSFSAVATYITNAKQFHEPEATIPPVFIVAGEYDSTVSTEGPCLLYASALEQGIDAEFHLNVPEPVTPGFFTRINGVDCDLSQEIIASFTDVGVLDDDGNVLVNPGDYSTWQPHLPPSASAYQNDVRDLLDERAAEHSLTHDFRQENILFFNQHATPLPMPEAFTCP